MGWHDSKSNPHLSLPMNLAVRSTGLVLLTLFSAVPAAPEEIGTWSFSENKAEDGATSYAASLPSTNLISSGYEEADYPAIYTIACKSGDPTKWSQWLKLEDALSGRGQTELIATVDKKSPREEFWTVGDNRHFLSRENVLDISELRTAKTLKLTWNWGWTWLWLSDKARFELGDIAAIIFTLAKSCGIPEP